MNVEEVHSYNPKSTGDAARYLSSPIGTHLSRVPGGTDRSADFADIAPITMWWYQFGFLALNNSPHPRHNTNTRSPRNKWGCMPETRVVDMGCVLQS
jgi:hypothetical protein